MSGWVGTEYKTEEEMKGIRDGKFWTWQYLFCEGYPLRLEIIGELY
jgi:hypothetical protein